jgi:N-methylhydantoinase A
LLRVGPTSARSTPGPACYGRGGENPTLTDACLILGLLNDKYFLGGDMEIDVDLSVKAIEEKLCKRLNMSVVDVAAGIYKVAVADMIEAIKMVSVQRGFDPRDFVMVPFGGGGPLFAGKLAIDLQVPKTIFPRNPGVFSAMGCLLADIQFDQSQSYLIGVVDLDPNKFNNILNDLENRSRNSLSEEGYTENLEVIRTADMRYVGQNFEVNTRIPEGDITKEALAELVERFHKEHERWYGYMMRDEIAEIVSVRVSVKSKRSFKPTYKMKETRGALQEALKGARKVYFGDEHGFVECPIYQRELLCPGHVIQGPAIIEQPDTTNVIYPKQAATVDKAENIVAISV